MIHTKRGFVVQALNTLDSSFTVNEASNNLSASTVSMLEDTSLRVRGGGVRLAAKIAVPGKFL